MQNAGEQPPLFDDEAPPSRRDELRALFERGREAYPMVPLDEAAFVRHVVRCAPRPAGASVGAALRGEGLYLCAACLEGAPGAAARFEALARAAVAPTLKRFGFGGAEHDDLMQQLLVRLLVGLEGGRPKLYAYNGRGPLEHWVRACAARLALSARRSARPTDSLDGELDAMSDGMASGAEPEVALLKRVCRAELKAAVASALEGLGPADRLLLRQYVIDGLTIDRLGALHGVHETTAYRRERDARARLVRLVRQHLVKSLGVNESDLDGIGGLLESRLDVSLRRLLNGP